MLALVCMVHAHSCFCVWFNIQWCACIIAHVQTWCLWAFCIPFCLCWIACVCILVTWNVVTVPSVQLLTVVLPPMLLQMVNEVALVQHLDPQWPTPVTEGTPCKETADVPAWPMDSGVGGHLLAIVSCTLFSFYFYMGVKSPHTQQLCSVRAVSCDI